MFSENEKNGPSMGNAEPFAFSEPVNGHSGEESQVPDGAPHGVPKETGFFNVVREGKPSSLLITEDKDLLIKRLGIHPDVVDAAGCRTLFANFFAGRTNIESAYHRPKGFLYDAIAMLDHGLNGEMLGATFLVKHPLRDADGRPEYFLEQEENGVFISKIPTGFTVEDYLREGKAIIWTRCQLACLLATSYHRLALRVSDQNGDPRAMIQALRYTLGAFSEEIKRVPHVFIMESRPPGDLGDLPQFDGLGFLAETLSAHGCHVTMHFAPGWCDSAVKSDRDELRDLFPFADFVRTILGNHNI